MDDWSAWLALFGLGSVGPFLKSMSESKLLCFMVLVGLGGFGLFVWFLLVQAGK